MFQVRIHGPAPLPWGTAPARAAEKHWVPGTRWMRSSALPAGRPIAVNATGCLEAFSTPYPETSWQLPWLHSLFEARRCLSCGNCFECDNCYGVCPDNAVIKLGPGQRYEIDYGYCKGCGICATECPSEAIAMEPEET